MFDAASEHGRMDGLLTFRVLGSTKARTMNDDTNTSPQDDQTVSGPLDEATKAQRLGELQGLIDLMRPAVQADGGDLVLVRADVESGEVEVELRGACSSCAVSSATLRGGVERILHDRLPWITEVLGGVDESMDPFESAALGQGGYVPSF
jgi:Fe-S cluster biogenesis protein NfuA